jgi:hypothetical protein
MKNYEVIDGEEGQLILLTEEDGKKWSIPTDPANSDYQAYLAQLEEPETAPDTL